MISQNEEIVIVGAGCFGTSAAYHLMKQGFSKITILDRSPTLPPPDAASNDINRVVRSSYSDLFYTKFAREAIDRWKDRDEWGDAYHESGVMVLGFSGTNAYADEAYKNDIALDAKVRVLPDGDAIRAEFPLDVPTALFDHDAGYLNCEGGWVNAGQGLSLMLSKVVDLGAKVLPGKRVRAVVRGEMDTATRRVECEDGSFYDASLVVIATGSWTSSSFPDLGSLHTCGLATGQCITMIQLTEEEASMFKDCPVVINFDSGFYIFPPNEKGIMKMATHVAGYTHKPDGKISRPRTVLSDPEGGLLIPKPDLQQIRNHLRKIYPSLAEKPFSATRLCWYNDTPDGNWIIGPHPADPSLIIATGGSGHAYKFLPVIGRLIADTIQRTLAPELTARFAVERYYTSSNDPSREGMLVKELPLDQLCTPEDLLASLSNESNKAFD